MNRYVTLLASIGTVLAVASSTSAHDGRRLEVVVDGNQLFARGYNSNGTDDGAGAVRPYYNALHDHWSNSPVSTSALADLPSFDVLDDQQSYVGTGAAAALEGGDLLLTLMGAKKWTPASPMGPFGTPELEDLSPGEVIFVGIGSQFVDTQGLGALTIATSIGAGGAADLDLNYQIGAHPVGVLYALEWRLSTTVPGIAESESLYTLLSPDGGSPAEKLHHASLHLERLLSTPLVPGDYSRDGQVDAADYLLWRDSFGQTGPHLQADANQDGVVDAVDYAVWRENLPASSESSNSAPAPSSALLAAALASLVCCGRNPVRACKDPVPRSGVLC